MGFSEQTHARSVVTQKKASGQTSPVYTSFEYTGKTAVTIIGNVTGVHYRFNYPGDKQNIDYRDMPGVMAIPVLRKVN